MSGIDDPRDPEVEEVNSRLAQGLEACRSIVSTYRVMISGERCDADPSADDS